MNAKTTKQIVLEKASSGDVTGALEAVMAETERASTLAEVHFDSDGNIGASTLGGLWRLATMYSRSGTVPTHFQNKPEDCLIAIQLAQRCKVDVFSLMQCCYVVHGKPGLEAKFAIAMLNSSGKIRGRVRWRIEKEGTKDAIYQAVVTDAATGQEIAGPKIDWALVKAEQWDTKKGSKWATMADMMFRYRAASWLIRTTYPEVLMGMATVEELQDVGEAAAPTQQSSFKAELEQVLEETTRNVVEPKDPVWDGDVTRLIDEYGARMLEGEDCDKVMAEAKADKRLELNDLAEVELQYRHASGKVGAK